MKIKLIKGYMITGKGKIVDWPEKITSALIRRGIAEAYIEPEKPKKKKAKKDV